MTAFDSAEDTQIAILDCAGTVFPFLSADEVRTATREGLSEWDSLATLSLITLIEETLDIMLTDDEVQEFTSVESIIAVLAKRNGATA
jgi:acyl carrier protein